MNPPLEKGGEGGFDVASFNAIYGHQKETAILKNAISSNRVAHAYLFTGPDGVGKRLIALAFAKAMNCAEIDASGAGGALDSCGLCADCSMMEAGVHPNLIQIQPVDKDFEPDPDGIIKIAQVRELQESIRFRVERGKKTAIVVGADRMALPAANAFLKTLEEPPASSVIILIASRTTELPATIISRCQRIAFKPLPEGVIREFLVEKRGMANEEALEVARLSGGSIGAAVKYIGAGFPEKRKEALGAFLALRANDTIGILKLAEGLSKRDDLEDILESLKTLLRDRAVCLALSPELAISKEGCTPGGGCTSGGGLFKNGGSVEKLCDSFSLIERARVDIMPPRYGNKQLAMDALLMGLAKNMAFL